MARIKTIHIILVGIPTLIFGGLSGGLLFLDIAELVTASPNGIPRVGAVPNRHDLSTWDIAANDDLFESRTQGNELHLGVPLNAWENGDLADDPDMYSWGGSYQTFFSHYQDFSASIDVRAVDADPTASGCLLVRSDPSNDADRFGFHYCLSEDYGLWAYWYDETGTFSEGDWLFFYEEQYIDALRPIEEWNQLKIVAKGETVWMFLNGEYIGVTRHYGVSRGGIGMSIDVERDTHGEFAFRNLDIRRLGWL